jgi:apolipoprotein N-acyltransferase
MKPHARIALGCLLAGLSGLLLTLSSAPYDAWVLVWVGFVPMAIAQHRVLPDRLSALAPALGVGGFILGSFGGVFPPSAAWYMKALPLLVGVLVYVASRGERARQVRARYAMWPLWAALGWVALELVRLFIPALGTWGYIGYAMYRQPWFLQPVSVVGVFGLDALIVLVNYGLAALAIAILDRRVPPPEAAPAIPLRDGARWCAIAAGAVVLWTALGLAARPGEGVTVRVAALQPGTRGWQPGDTPAAHDRRILDLLSQQTRRAAAEGAKVIVWPEGALRADPVVAFDHEIASLAREAGAYLVVGYVVESPAGHRNEALTVGPDGAFLGTYGKAHPVVFLGGTSLTRGQYPTYDTPFGVLGAMICADMDFTDTAREFAHRGAKVIAVPSADWAAIAPKHYVLGVFRALETRAVLVKSEFSRDSAIVDGSGVLLATAVTPRETSAVLVADVKLRAGLPLAARFGDWFGWLCLGTLVIRGLVRRLGRNDHPARMQALSGSTRRP